MEEVFYIDEKTKTAIANLIVNLINADGIVYKSEMDSLRVIKHKYNLTSTHFKNVNTMTLAAAINQIITVVKREKSLNLYQNINKDLVTIAGVDGSISPDEAMICLALRYAFDFPNAHIFEYKYNSLKFAKKEIIFIEDSKNEKLEEESSKYYDSLNSLLEIYGFNYIFIPNIQKEFGKEEAKDFFEDILEYLYPNRTSDNVIDQLMLKLIDEKLLYDFSDQIMREGAGIQSFSPSLLIKINESTVYSTKSKAQQKYFNLLQLPIRTGYRIQDTVQNFIRKYRSLVGPVHSYHNYDSEVKFNIRSFQRTLLDYCFAMDKEYEQVNAIFLKKGKQKCFLKFGSLKEAKLSVQEQIYYLLICYLCETAKHPLKDGIKDGATYILHKKIFDAMAQAVGMFEEFTYSFLYKNYTKISNKINKAFPNESNSLLYKINKNKQTKEYTIGMKLVITININNKSYNLVEWINSLLKKH